MVTSSHPELDWLYQTQMYGIKLGLDNVHRLLAELELSGPGMKFIHIAGTNGKGSTCALIQHGYRPKQTIYLRTQSDCRPPGWDGFRPGPPGGDRTAKN